MAGRQEHGISGEHSGVGLGTKVTHICFLDDAVLGGEIKENVEFRYEKVKQVYLQLGLKISTRKAELKEVGTVRYLGELIDSLEHAGATKNEEI